MKGGSINESKETHFSAEAFEEDGQEPQGSRQAGAHRAESFVCGRQKVESQLSDVQKNRRKCEISEKLVLNREEAIMSKTMKGMLLVLILMYVLSPVDFVPGPVDDLIAIVIGLAAQKRIRV